ncbi:MAG: hypothetical protein KDJ35_07135 [Alphaproteobacteria bacterium]|nr:hypothetical protein [Alphaproteobacteria bacterium]
MFFSVLSLSAWAEVLPGTSCDTQVYDVLSDRAWMEGQREMEVAEKLILKPDSVLEYSCFAQRRNELRQYGMVWSSTSALDDGDITSMMIELTALAAAQAILLGDSSGLEGIIESVGEGLLGGIIANAGGDPLELLVDPVLQNYLSENFYHSLGGGVYDGTGGGGVCDSMNVIWSFLKCNNFDEDTFFKFSDLAANDYRDLPMQCPAGTRNADWANAIAGANPPAATPATNGGMDAIQTRSAMLDLTCPEAPIPLGVQVTGGAAGDVGFDHYTDMVCSAPGCYYTPTSETTGVCRRSPP